MRIVEKMLWALIGLWVEPKKKLAVLSSEKERKILGGCRTFNDYIKANDDYPYYQDEVIGEKILYGLITRARGGKNFELALRRTICTRQRYAICALARKAKTFDEAYVILGYWNVYSHPVMHISFFELFMADILYKKCTRMVNTSERRERMLQLDDLSTKLGYSLC
jgi:hypothetical protein